VLRSVLPPGQLRRYALYVAVGLMVAALAIQLVPYGRDHSLPDPRVEPAWDSPLTRELTVKACFDCHSNEVRWPWYSQIAPISWLVYRDVVEGRDALNFSEWDRPQDEADEAAETVREDSMPPWFYLLPHPEARLNDMERAALIRGLEATLGSEREDDD
jgi:hypothetical protein